MSYWQITPHGWQSSRMHDRCKRCGFGDQGHDLINRRAIEIPSKTGLAIRWLPTDNQTHTGNPPAVIE
jgi:hypothetical protein